MDKDLNKIAEELAEKIKEIVDYNENYSEKKKAVEAHVDNVDLVEFISWFDDDEDEDEDDEG